VFVEMVFVIGVGIVLAAAIAVCVPLWRGAMFDGTPTEAGEAAAPWQKQKTEAYAAIKEAELDLQMGKLSPEDYRAIRAVQEVLALEALKALEGEQVTRAGAGGAPRVCAACGETAGAGPFCAACGAALAT
jgi:hypothetical protein